MGSHTAIDGSRDSVKPLAARIDAHRFIHEERVLPRTREESYQPHHLINDQALHIVFVGQTLALEIWCCTVHHTARGTSDMGIGCGVTPHVIIRLAVAVMGR